MASVIDEKRRRQEGEEEPEAGSGPHGSHPSREAELSEAADGLLVPDLAGVDDDEAPPAYGKVMSHLQFSQPGFDAGADITSDGRVDININTKNGRLQDLLGPVIQRQITAASLQEPLPPAYIPPSLGGQTGQTPPPRLNVVIQIVGSRGDVQPFVALGKVLKDTYQHRVRIATHPTFQSFIEENGLEFFSIGGDPAELMAFMVKHPGLMPGIDALKSGEVSKRRKGIQQMLAGCWRSCIEAGNGLGPPPPSLGRGSDLFQTAHDEEEPFVADAIIANPPSFAHVHIAEKLGIPLHMMFTMPWSPTRAFPHPLANIQSSTADEVLTSYLSYTLVEMMTWQGLGDIINRFREKALDLSPLSLLWAPGLLTRLRVPYTYCWSPTLIPKPKDWGNNIDIAGFYFLDLASSFTPDPDLAEFLRAGPPPVYIGFGSIVVEDPNKMTRMIFDAIHLSGTRALVSKGWGGLGADEVGVPDGVFMLGNVPHDWLFQHVSCVVHHGGAGTTAAGIKAGKPTLVVPFFGDQPFWGAMISRAGAGPDPIPYKALTAENLAEGIKFCLEPGTVAKAKEYGEKIREEKGADTGGQRFHAHLKVASLRCTLAPSRTAVWRVRKTRIRLSPLAATVLVERGIIKLSDMKLYRSIEYNTEDQPHDPISAGAVSLISDISSIGMSAADIPRGLFKSRSPSKTKDQGQVNERGERSTSGTDANTVSSDATRHTPQGSNTDLSQISRDPSGLQPGTTLDQGDLQKNSHLPSSGSPLQEDQDTNQRKTSKDRLDLEMAMDAGKNVGNIVVTGVRSPMNFCLGLARGFRNIPKLYNDDMIRPVEKVTSFQSGMKVASKELGYGFFDGITGLVTQPIRGMKKEGPGGFVKGVGKGIGGLVAKPGAGIWGVPAYLMQGVNVEVSKLLSQNVQNHLIASRVLQGRVDLADATPEEQDDIVLRWTALGDEVSKFRDVKSKGKASATSATAVSQDEGLPTSPPPPPRQSSRGIHPDSKQRLYAQSDAWEKTRGRDESLSTQASSRTPATFSSSDSSQDAEFELAIEQSVRETSRGNPEEDARIEAAIRQSVAAVRQQGELPTPTREKEGKGANIFDDEEYKVTDEEYQMLIEKALQESLTSREPSELRSEIEPSYRDGHGSESANPNSKNDPDSDLQRAIRESRESQPPVVRDSDDYNEDLELQRAIAASKAEQDRRTTELNEEETEVEKVKKQSMAEDEERRRAMGTRKKGGDDDDDDDEDLKRALEESLKVSRGVYDDAGPSGSGL